MSIYDISGTEWPIFGTVFYLWATESLQEAWEKDPALARVAPKEYARGAIEAALRGPMAAMLPAEESKSVIAWVQAGAERAQYESDIKAVLEKRCLSCHDGSNPHLSNLGNFESVKKVTEQDTGTDIFTLVRVSHIHLFGMTFIFFIMGTIFSHAYLRPVWLKSLVVVLPFIAIAMDVGSWYFTKLFHPFALMTMAGGGVMALSFTFMGVVSTYQLWFGKTPAPVLERAADKSGGL